MNPIFIEYYSHTDCDCYKINIPWTQYKQEILVLCPVSEGIEKARRLALTALTDKLNAALVCPVVDDTTAATDERPVPLQQDVYRLIILRGEGQGIESVNLGPEGTSCGAVSAALEWLRNMETNTKHPMTFAYMLDPEGKLVDVIAAQRSGSLVPAPGGVTGAADTSEPVLKRGDCNDWYVYNPTLPMKPCMKFYVECRDRSGTDFKRIWGETNDLAYLVERLRFSFGIWDNPPHYWAIMDEVEASPFRKILFEEKTGENKPLPPQGIPSKDIDAVMAPAPKYEYDGVTYLDDVEPSVVVAALQELGAKGWHVVGGGPWAQPSLVSRDCHGTLTWLLERTITTTK